MKLKLDIDVKEAEVFYGKIDKEKAIALAQNILDRYFGSEYFEIDFFER